MIRGLFRGGQAPAGRVEPTVFTVKVHGSHRAFSQATVCSVSLHTGQRETATLDFAGPHGSKLGLGDAWP